MDAPSSLQAGAEVAGFRVVAKWREGSMAVLYRVADADGGEHLLKLPRLGFGSHPACYAGFEAEQAILERLAGPHVPRLRASGDGDGGPYLVIDRVAGSSLADIAAAAPLPAAEVARLGAALAFALHDLHRQNVVHHDLKPSHVILRPDGTAVLIDFGLARHGDLPDLV
ncbi:MAG: phosphotransferase, partial [Rhodocyclaceae bacterium]|nr:phosphotransferase [Rhodocyclaceae bacterium]